jgi:hypothetical protein
MVSLDILELWVSHEDVLHPPLWWTSDGDMGNWCIVVLSMSTPPATTTTTTASSSIELASTVASSSIEAVEAR